MNSRTNLKKSSTIRTELNFPKITFNNLTMTITSNIPKSYVKSKSSSVSSASKLGACSAAFARKNTNINNARCLL